MPQIPLFKVYMAPEAKQLVATVLDSGYVGQGSIVDEFEKELQRLFGCPERLLTVNSCTSGTDLCFALLGIRPGDEVITTPVTCFATNSHLYLREANIIWADVDPITGLIDPDDVSRKVTPRTKLIVAVDYGGDPCAYDRLKSFGVPVLEDAAHAILTNFGGRHISQSGGDYVCWSFQAIKHLTCVDGGAIKVPPAQFERARLLRWYGYNRDLTESFRCSQDLVEIGYKYHMNNVNASVGMANIKHVQKIVDRQRSVAKFFCEAIRHDEVIVPRWNPSSSYWLFTVLAKRRAALQGFLQERGIQSSQVHARNDVYTALKAFARDVPGVDAFANRNLSIPVGWWLSDSDVQFVVDAVNSWS